MPEMTDRITTEMTNKVFPLVQQVGKQLEDLQDIISISPSDGEITEALGTQASSPERDAYRLGHQSGWYKGALMFGCAVLAGLAVLTFSASREVKELEIKGS